LTERINPKTATTGKGNHLKISIATNESYKLVNHFQAKGHTVFYDKENEFFYIKNGDINDADKEWFIQIEKTKSIPSNLTEVKKPKIGLYKSWVANMDEGWTRWILTEFEFDYDTLHDSDIIGKDLSAYDAIIIPDQREGRILSGHSKGFMPDQYTGGLGLGGSLSLKEYVDQGGRIIAFDKASNFVISTLNLPVKNITKPLAPSRFFIPGSLLGIKVRNTTISNGMNDDAIASFSRSSAFEMLIKKQEGEGGKEETVEPAVAPPHEVIATYQKSNLLKSGYAQNAEKYIGNKIAVVRIPKEKGDVILFGFRPQFRGQSHNTYKLIFNSFYFKK